MSHSEKNHYVYDQIELICTVTLNSDKNWTLDSQNLKVESVLKVKKLKKLVRLLDCMYARNV